jgi:hypothetical protein
MFNNLDISNNRTILKEGSMLTSKHYLAIVVTAILALNASSTIHRVDNNPANNPDFTSLQEAHDAAAAGDTIYVSGSVSNYGGLDISKTLYIFGPGYFLDENPETSANLLQARIGGLIYFRSGSEGSLLTGFVTSGMDLYVYTSDISLKRNRIYNHNGIRVNSSNQIISQNYIESPITIVGSPLDIIIRNNFIAEAGDNAINAGGGSLNISQNILLGDVVIFNSDFTNNILREGNFSATNCVILNNIGNSTQFGTENGNQENVDMNTVFIGTGSTDGIWQLATGSPAIGAGVSGEDCGMFGGADPYILSGLPAFPAIYFFVAPAAASGMEGLPVQVKIKSHK